ncbi:MAG: hypothetical protein P4L46_19290 [Fimbriimonas sp.]|nr:hypothetical protein [Fimbriimonas sp.]
MTLNVPFEQFAETVQRVLETKEAYVSAAGAGCLVSAADVGKGFIVASRTDQTAAATKAKLEPAGFTVYDGAWTLAVDSQFHAEPQAEAFIAAVSYRSGETTPGVWVDAFPTMPTQVQVLRALYDEFRQTGELPDVSFEEFVRLSDPNVVVVTPNDVQSFLERKAECP